MMKRIQTYLPNGQGECQAYSVPTFSTQPFRDLSYHFARAIVFPCVSPGEFEYHYSQQRRQNTVHAAGSGLTLVVVHFHEVRVCYVEYASVGNQSIGEPFDDLWREQQLSFTNSGKVIWSLLPDVRSNLDLSVYLGVGSAS